MKSNYGIVLLRLSGRFPLRKGFLAGIPAHTVTERGGMKGKTARRLVRLGGNDYFAAYWYKRIGMKKEYIPFVEELIELAIREDIGDGDHTSLATIPADARGKMQLLVKQDGIIAGIEVARMVFDRLDGSVAFDQRIEDGACVRRGDIAFYVEGRILSLLQAERIVLNIMQRMSGVATQTAAYVKLLEGTHCRVLDTRKTTPGMRVLDKMAVKLGGGENHRMDFSI